MDGAGGGLAVRVTDQIMLPVPPARVERYGTYKGRDDDARAAAGASVRVPRAAAGRAGRGSTLQVDVVEPMGMETMVHFFIGGRRRSVPASIRPPMPRPSEMLALTADMNNMHLMEPDTGRVV